MFFHTWFGTRFNFSRHLYGSRSSWFFYSHYLFYSLSTHYSGTGSKPIPDECAWYYMKQIHIPGILKNYENIFHNSQLCFIFNSKIKIFHEHKTSNLSLKGVVLFHLSEFQKEFFHKRLSCLLKKKDFWKDRKQTAFIDTLWKLFIHFSRQMYRVRFSF